MTPITSRIILGGSIAGALIAMAAAATQFDHLTGLLATDAELEEVRIELAGSVNANTANVLGIRKRDTNRSLDELQVDIQKQGNQPTKEQRRLLRRYKEDIEEINKALRKLQ